MSGVLRLQMKVLLIFLIVHIMVIPARAGVILDADEAVLKRDGVVQEDAVDLFADPATGWKPLWRGKDKEISEYLFFDLSAAPVNTSEGTIRATIRRDEQYRDEALLNFAASDLTPLWSLYFTWDDPGDGLELNYFGDLDFLSSSTPVPSRPEKGDLMTIMIRWRGESFEILLDGRPLPVRQERPSRISEILTRAAYLIVGTETDPARPAGGWSQLASELVSFTVYDTYELWDGEGIRSVNHNAFDTAGYSGRLVEGDTVTVTVLADPGGYATFDIETVANGIPMTEDPEDPGTYRGTYTVQYGDAIEDGKVTAHFLTSLDETASPRSAVRPMTIDTAVRLEVMTSNDLVPADETSRSGLTVTAADANGKAIRDRELKLTLSTTDDYTGNSGGIAFNDLIGGVVDVDWGGVTDSFGEVTAQYISGFAAKTILVSAKDMTSGDVGVGYVRSYIDGQVDIVVTEPQASALSVAGSMDVSLSRSWLTADGKSRSRITAIVKDASGAAVSGHNVKFTLLGDNGEIRMVQGKTDSRGRALADYIAGILMGQVQVEVRDLTSGLTAVVSIELRPDAPAEIILAAEPGEVETGGQSTVSATVTDANGNPNHNVDILYNIVNGEGALDSDTVATDEDGTAAVTFMAGDTAGLVTVRGTVISRAPTAEEISAAEGAVFLYGLDEDPGRLEVVQWLVKAGEEVVKGQELVALEDRSDNTYTVRASRDGIVSTFVAEERDRVEYGDTLGYIIEIAE